MWKTGRREERKIHFCLFPFLCFVWLCLKLYVNLFSVFLLNLNYLHWLVTYFLLLTIGRNKPPIYLCVFVCKCTCVYILKSWIFTNIIKNTVSWTLEPFSALPFVSKSHTVLTEAWAGTGHPARLHSLASLAFSCGIISRFPPRRNLCTATVPPGPLLPLFFPISYGPEMRTTGRTSWRGELLVELRCYIKQNQTSILFKLLHCHTSVKAAEPVC